MPWFPLLCPDAALGGAMPQFPFQCSGCSGWHEDSPLILRRYQCQPRHASYSCFPQGSQEVQIPASAVIQSQPDPSCILLSRHPRGQPGEFPGGSVVKIRLPAQETRVPSLGQRDPLEEEMATHSSMVAWVIPRTEEPGGIESVGSQRVRHS